MTSKEIEIVQQAITSKGFIETMKLYARHIDKSFLETQLLGNILLILREIGMHQYAELKTIAFECFLDKAQKMEVDEIAKYYKPVQYWLPLYKGNIGEIALFAVIKKKCTDRDSWEKARGSFPDNSRMQNLCLQGLQDYPIV